MALLAAVKEAFKAFRRPLNVLTGREMYCPKSEYDDTESQSSPEAEADRYPHLERTFVMV